MKNLFFLVVTTILTSSCSPKIISEKWLTDEAPTSFTARFETTQGNFEIEARREWSPKAVDRLYQLIKNEFYNDIAIYRVVPNFVAQFGIHNNKVVNDFWEKYKIDDESVIEKNKAMTISFARAGKKSRSTQLFINLKNNTHLDKISSNGVKGFPVVAKVISGKEVVKKFYNGYGDKLGMNQGAIHKQGNTYIRDKYPKTDFIFKAYLIKK